MIDFQGILYFDPQVALALKQFLEEKETKAARLLVQLFLPSALTDGSWSELSSAVALLQVNLPQLSASLEGDPAQKRFKLAALVQEVNRIMWDVTEVFEATATEFFQQIDSLSIRRFQPKTLETIETIYQLLSQHVESLILNVLKLIDLFQACFKWGIKRWRLFFVSFLWRGKKRIDPHLLRHLRQTALYLKESFDAFEKKVSTFFSLREQIAPFLEKQRKFPVHAIQREPRAQLFEEVVELLQLIDLSEKSEKKLTEELALSLKSKMCKEGSFRLFRHYGDAIEEALFKTSREWKAAHRKESGGDARASLVKEQVKKYCEELASLIETVAHYRRFLLKFDANPYRRSRLGFSEWRVAPENQKSEKLASLIFRLYETKTTFESFEKSLEEPLPVIKERESHFFAKIEAILSEIGQPLLSQLMMKKRCASLLQALEKLEEISSPFFETVLEVQEILLKAMRLDWKDHVLYDFPLFHRLYHLHLGVMRPLEEPSHTLRLERFSAQIDQIKKYLEKEGWDHHLLEIEAEMNEMRSTLQDFLAPIQRIAKEKAPDWQLRQRRVKLCQELLEYRYLFGQFFHFLTLKSSRGMKWRDSFLFVDQYFEGAQHLLSELKEEERPAR